MACRQRKVVGMYACVYVRQKAHLEIVIEIVTCDFAGK